MLQITKIKWRTCYKFAFTLAEIMMVLVILGVVAAITIPSTIAHFDKIQRETRLKMAYSIFSNLIEISQAENGPVNGWPRQNSWSNITPFAQTYITPYLNINYECTGKIKPNKCFYGGAWHSSKGSQFGGGYDEPTGSHMFRLKNGMSVGIAGANANNVNCGVKADIVVDIDGPNKGYSIAGRDVFFFQIGNDSKNPFFPHRSNTTDGNNGAMCAGGTGTKWARLFYQNGFKTPAIWPKETTYSNTGGSYTIATKLLKGMKNGKEVEGYYSEELFRNENKCKNQGKKYDSEIGQCK